MNQNQKQKKENVLNSNKIRINNYGSKLSNFILTEKKENNTFVAKYIKLGTQILSSGERAYLNIITRLSLLLNHNKFKRDLQKGLSKNVLLLIDEIDLYMHPEWQRRIINELVNFINKYFNDNRLQIIFFRPIHQLRYQIYQNQIFCFF